jgi:hypothetical protein
LVSRFSLLQSFSYTHYLFYKKRFKKEINSFCIWILYPSSILSAHTPPCCQAGAEFSFDFLLLLLLASAIAFMGLLESSSVVLGTPVFFSTTVHYAKKMFLVCP